MSKIKIKMTTIYRDGGTSVWMEPSVIASVKTIEEAQNAQKYYLDKRFGSATIGELFDAYPSKGGKQLDKENYEFI